MATKERAGALDIPRWWMDKALASLGATTLTQEEIARRASSIAGRTSPWDKSAISKFRSGQGHTVDLINAISDVFGIVRPIYLAPTESTAQIIAEIVRNELSHLDEKSSKLAVVDAHVATEIHDVVVDRPQQQRVLSRGYGGASRGDGGRARSARRRRA